MNQIPNPQYGYPESPYPAQQADNHFEREQESLLTIIWRRKMIISFMVAVGIAVGYTMFTKQPPVFQSQARMLIINPQIELPVNAGQMETQYDSIHEQLIRSPILIDQAVNKYKLDQLPTMLNKNATANIIAGISVSDVQGKEGFILHFAYSGSNPDDCKTILNAVVRSYEDFLEETYKNTSQEMLSLISQAKNQLDDQLKQTESDYQEFRNTAQLLFRNDGGQNVHQQRLIGIESQRAEIIVEMAQTTARRDAIKKAIEDGGSQEAINVMVSTIRPTKNQSSEGATLEDQLFPLIIEEQLLLEDYGPEHPKVKAITKKIALIRKHLGQEPMQPEQKVKQFYEIYLESLDQEIATAQQRINELNRLFEQERNAAKELADVELTDQNFRNDIARKESLFNVVISRLEEVNLVQDTGGGTPKSQLLNYPGFGIQIAPSLNKYLATSGILGLLAGFVFAYLAELADSRFRSPAEIQQQLQCQVVGHVPYFENIKLNAKNPYVAKLQGISPTLRSLYEPKSTTAESYRGMRTNLFMSLPAERGNVVEVTSPSPGDGKSTVAANLAITIASSGKRTLLIDGDFHKHTTGALFGIKSANGLTSVLTGQCEVVDAVIETRIKNLSIMTAGVKVPSPADLLTSTDISSLFEVLREQFDYIIVDTPPALAVTDPLIIAPHVDLLLVTLRLNKYTRASGQQIMQQLRQIGVENISLVINAVPQGRHGYGGYSYGYDYRYGGGYGYGYGYQYGKRKGGYGGYTSTTVESIGSLLIEDTTETNTKATPEVAGDTIESDKKA